MAEALAVLEAISQARYEGRAKICIKSDSQMLIRAINSGKHQKELYGILHDINQIAACFLEISFVFISRTANCEADSLAKYALSLISAVSSVSFVEILSGLDS